MRRTAQILTQSKHSGNHLSQPVFHTENATLLSESAVFAPCTDAPPAVGGFRVVTGKLIYCWALRAPCAETPPIILRKRPVCNESPRSIIGSSHDWLAHQQASAAGGGEAGEVQAFVRVGVHTNTHTQDVTNRHREGAECKDSRQADQTVKKQA